MSLSSREAPEPCHPERARRISVERRRGKGLNLCHPERARRISVERRRGRRQKTYARENVGPQSRPFRFRHARATSREGPQPLSSRASASALSSRASETHKRRATSREGPKGIRSRKCWAAVAALPVSPRASDVEGRASTFVIPSERDALASSDVEGGASKALPCRCFHVN
jgi:hypothetical protein